MDSVIICSSWPRLHRSRRIAPHTSLHIEVWKKGESAMLMDCAILCRGILKTTFQVACLLLFSRSAFGQTATSMVPQTLDFPSGKLHLKAYLWKPAGTGPFPAVLFNHGSGGDDADHTAGMPITQAASVLAPFFVKHGYVFLYPFRRGHGPSASQAPFMQDVLRREEQANGEEA